MIGPKSRGGTKVLLILAVAVLGAIFGLYAFLDTTGGSRVGRSGLLASDAVKPEVGETMLVPSSGGTGEAGHADAKDAETPAERIAVTPSVPLEEAAPTSSVRVNVLVLAEEDREPVAGVALRLRADDGTRVDAVTDGEGRVVVEWSGATPARIDFRHEQYTDRYVLWQEVPELEAEILLLPAASIQVSVNAWAAGPETSVTIDLWRGSRGNRVELGPDGEHLYEGLEPGTYDLFAWAVDPNGVVSSVGEHQDIVLESGESYAVVMDLDGPARVSGRVVGLEARVFKPAVFFGCTMEGWPKQLGGLHWKVDCDPAGNFESPVPLGRMELFMILPEGGRLERSVEATRSGELLRVEFRLKPPAVVTGLVIDPDGNPVAGAYVELRHAGEPVRLHMPMHLRRAGQSQGVFAIREPLWEQFVLGTETDASGNYMLEGVPAGFAYSLAAWPPLADRCVYAPGVKLDWRARPGARQEGVKIRLRKARTLTGRVTSMTGDTVAGAHVTLSANRGKTGLYGQSALTDEVGAFSFECVLGEGAKLSIRHGDYQGYASKVSPADWESGLDVQLEPAWALSGVVVDREGYGVKGVRVYAQRIFPLPVKSERGGRGRDSTDRYGRFLVKRLSRGRWSLEAAGTNVIATDRSRIEVDLPREPVPIELVVDPALRPERAEIYGVAVIENDGSGDPLPRLIVEGLRGGQLERDGERFFIHNMRPGRTRVRLSAKGCLRWRSERLELTPGARVDLGEIHLARATRLTVRVFDENDQPVRKARVRLLPLPPEKGGLKGARAMTLNAKSPGRYVLQAAPRATWRLRVEHPKHKGKTRNLVIKPRKEQSQRIVIEKR